MLFALTGNRKCYMFSCVRGVSEVKNFTVSGIVCCSTFLTGEVNNAQVKRKEKQSLEPTLNPLPDSFLNKVRLILPIKHMY